MKFLLLLLFSLMLSITAHAGFEGIQTTTSLGVFNKIKCSTGLTCTRVAGKFNMVSSPTLVAPLTLEGDEVLSNAVDDVVQIASNDSDLVFSIYSPLTTNGDATLRLIADASADSGDDWQIQNDGATNDLLFQNDVSGSQATKMKLSKNGALSGYIQSQVVVTATTITAAQCGSTFISGAVLEIELPEASAVLGCRLTFIIGSVHALTIDPDDADIILIATNAAGDSLIADLPGESITIEAISATEWAYVGAPYGTWTDSD